MSIKPINSQRQRFSWWAPSNIALVKYWGKKKGLQLPANPSVSLTLNKARTHVTLEVIEASEDGFSELPWIDLLFSGQKMPSFIPKIEKFFNHVHRYLPYLKGYKFLIHSENTFPHSAGIASSASSMAAMALCLRDFAESKGHENVVGEDFLEQASFLSRMGSGSACRSLFPTAASWGEADGFGHDDRATSIECHEIFQNMHDSIVVVSGVEKKVSSRAGHGLMDEHFYGSARYQHALTNWRYAMEWLKDGSWDNLGNLVEEEALTLHAMMMTSRPGYLLMEPNTIKAIHLVRDYRYDTGVPVYFTLDAGPNLHLLYPQKEQAQVKDFITGLVKKLGHGTSVIHDQVGLGPQRFDPLDRGGPL